MRKKTPSRRLPRTSTRKLFARRLFGSKKESALPLDPMSSASLSASAPARRSRLEKELWKQEVTLNAGDDEKKSVPDVQETASPLDHVPFCSSTGARALLGCLEIENELCAKQEKTYDEGQSGEKSSFSQAPGNVWECPGSNSHHHKRVPSNITTVMRRDYDPMSSQEDRQDGMVVVSKHPKKKTETTQDNAFASPHVSHSTHVPLEAGTVINADYDEKKRPTVTEELHPPFGSVPGVWKLDAKNNDYQLGRLINRTGDESYEIMSSSPHIMGLSPTWADIPVQTREGGNAVSSIKESENCIMNCRDNPRGGREGVSNRRWDLRNGKSSEDSCVDPSTANASKDHKKRSLATQGLALMPHAPDPFFASPSARMLTSLPGKKNESRKPINCNNDSIEMLPSSQALEHIPGPPDWADGPYHKKVTIKAVSYVMEPEHYKFAESSSLGPTHSPPEADNAGSMKLPPVTKDRPLPFGSIPSFTNLTAGGVSTVFAETANELAGHRREDISENLMFPISREQRMGRPDLAYSACCKVGKDYGESQDVSTIGRERENYEEGVGANDQAYSFDHRIIFLGKEAVAKTTTFEKIIDEKMHEDSRSCHCETPGIGVTHHNGHIIEIIDPPGPGTSGYGCSLHFALTCKPLNGIFLLIEFHPRIGSRMIDDYWEVVSKLKSEYLEMVTVIITKIDRFKPGEMWASLHDLQENIKEVFEEDAGVEHVLFSCPNMCKEDLLAPIYEQIKDLPLRQLEYTNTEIIQFFGMKEKICQQIHPLARNIKEGDAHDKMLIGEDRENPTQCDSEFDHRSRTPFTQGLPRAGGNNDGIHHDYTAGFPSEIVDDRIFESILKSDEDPSGRSSHDSVGKELLDTVNRSKSTAQQRTKQVEQNDYNFCSSSFWD